MLGNFACFLSSADLDPNSLILMLFLEEIFEKYFFFNSADDNEVGKISQHTLRCVLEQDTFILA